ncbi:MAG TPA: ABC transporter transmembrane domain-containing protein, partial [Gammaproteobacteria bacterium]
MKPRRSFGRLCEYLRPYIWPYFATAMACMVLYSATSGAVPYLIRSLVDDVLGTRNESMLRLLPVLIIAIFALRGIVNFGQTYLGEYIGQHIVYDVRRALSEKIHHLPASYFDSVSTGSVLSRITTDVLQLREALTEGGNVMVRDATTVVALVGVVFYLDWQLALVTFVVFPAVVLPLQALSRRMRTLSKRGLDSLGNLSALMAEAIVGNRVVKAFVMEDYEAERFDTESRRLLRLYLRAARIKAFTTPLMEVLSAFGIASVLWYGGASVLGGGRTTGSFAAFLAALVLLYDPFKKIVRANNMVQTGLGAADRIFEILDLEGEPTQRTGERCLTGLRDAIRLEGVSFAYGSDAVLHDADLTIEVGKAVALVGPSGGGKSTIADLIPRFYEVTSGCITIDGVDVREFEIASLRRQIAVVTQFTFLFNDTVRNNIAYGSLDKSDENVRAAARAANAHEFIEALPGGYETVVGELGVQLSGGQRQRIAIARALLKDAPILILDEATSALDSESERLVQRAIERLMEGRTTLVIAHRL